MSSYHPDDANKAAPNRATVYAIEMSIFVTFSVFFLLIPLACCFFSRCFGKTTRTSSSYNRDGSTAGSDNAAVHKYKSCSISSSSRRSLCLPLSSVDTGRMTTTDALQWSRSSSLHARQMLLLPYDPGQRLGFNAPAAIYQGTRRSLSEHPSAAAIRHYQQRILSPIEPRKFDTHTRIKAAMSLPNV